MHSLVLHGALGEEFGKYHRIDGKTPASLIYGFMLQNKKFANWEDDYNYKVALSSIGCVEVNKLTMALKLKPREDVHLIPSLEEGIKLNFRTILGITLLTIGFYYAAPAVAGGAWSWSTPLLGGLTTAGKVALWGGLLLFGSIIGFFDPQEQDEPTTPDRQKSFLFDGPVNKARSGVALPLVYGRIRTGSVLVSSQLSVKEYEGKVN